MKTNTFFIICLIGITLRAQSTPSGNITLDEIAVQLSGLNINGLLQKNERVDAAFSLGFFKFGFNNIRAETKNSPNKQVNSLSIGGPNIDLNDF